MNIDGLIHLSAYIYFSLKCDGCVMCKGCWAKPCDEPMVSALESDELWTIADGLSMESRDMCGQGPLCFELLSACLAWYHVLDLGVSGKNEFFFVINSIFGKFQFLGNFNSWWNFLKTGIWTFIRNFHHGMIPLVLLLDKSSVFEKFQRIQPDPSRLMRCLGSIL